MLNRTKGIIFAYSLNLSLFVIYCGVGLINATLVDLATYFSKDISVFGQLASISAFSWSIFGLFISPFSEKIGHKNMVILGTIILMFALIIFGISPNYLFLLFAAIIIGLSGSFTGPNVLMAVEDVFSKNILGKMIATVTVSIPLAQLIGVPILIILSGFLGWRSSYLILAFFSGLTLIPLCLIKVPTRNFNYIKITQKNYFLNFRNAFKDKSFSRIIIANTLSQLIYWLFGTYFATYFLFHFNHNATKLALFLAIMAIGQTVGTFIGGFLADKIDRIQISLFFTFILGIFGQIFGVFVTNEIFSLALGTLIMLCYAIVRPSFFAIVLSVSEIDKGTVMGIQAMSNHLGRALGAFFGGLILSLFNFFIMGIFGFIFTIITVVLYLNIRGINKLDQEPSPI